MNNYIKQFKEISIADVATVGGKNASLGEMFSKLASRGIAVPDGFATTAFAFEEFLSNNLLHAPLHELMFELDKKNFSNLAATGAKARELILAAELPQNLQHAVIQDTKDCVVRSMQKWLFAAAPLPKICQRQVLQGNMKAI
mgnify:CR=1 FL=1